MTYVVVGLSRVSRGSVGSRGVVCGLVAVGMSDDGDQNGDDEDL